MYLRVSVTDRCNLRCVYCLPEDAVFASERCRTDELETLMRLVVEEADIYKIRLTGGEPTLHPDLIRLTRSAAALTPGRVGLTSNGISLAPLLADLQTAGLTRLNISIDAVDEQGFQAMSRRTGLAKVMTAIDEAQALGFDPLKINAVAMRGVDFVGLTRLALQRGLHLRFIELMAIGVAQEFRPAAYIDAAAIRGLLFAAGLHLTERRDLDEPTSRVWTVPDADPRHCSIGFITTSSEPFCATCDRLRLTSQGSLHNCLFDDQGVDLLTPLRAGDDTEVRRRIRQHVAAKAPPERFIRHGAMASIGG